MGVRLGLMLVWLLHFLPLRLLAAIGNIFGMALYWLGHERRRVARINLRLCFPGMADDEREKLVRRHFRVFGRSLLERGILWWSRAERIKRLVRIEGWENLAPHLGKPLILMVPHFVGLDTGWTRLTLEHQMASIYSKQKNPVFNQALLRGRLRFGMPRLLSRQEGIRPIVKAVRDGLPLYYLPDMDYGPRDALFVPFFGVATATITGLARLANMTDARVVPCIVRQLSGGRGYAIRFYPAWENYPGADVEADTKRMNAFIEERVREMPEQYFWLHKRFKTRPPGEPGIYKQIGL